MQDLKRSIKSHLPILSRIWKYFIHRSYKTKSPDQIFEDIYSKNRWADRQSLSGSGSSLMQTAEVRTALPVLVEEFGIRRMLDVPCGDFSWMSQVDLTIDYTGGDIVGELIKLNQQKYSQHNRRFLKIDILNDALPEADLLLCRDCLVHFSYRHIFQALRNIRSSKCTYVLLTTFTRRENNRDVTTGAWRALNLQAAPFHFPTPIAMIDEKCMEDNGAYLDKHLGLWKVSEIPLDRALEVHH
jgi:hypothetical protein